ncbi:Protein mpe1 [Umbelopsis sp. WA50703]
MSVVYYKFKAAKDQDFDVYTFDGAGTSVFDLKREIIRAKKLGKGTDFDLAIYNSQSNEEYKDDLYTIPRNTSIIVRRLPPSRPGKGTAQRYVSGAMPNDGKGLGQSGAGVLRSGPPTSGSGERFGAGRSNVFDARQQRQQQHATNTPPGAAAPAQDQNTEPAPEDDSEEAKIAAMFQQTTDQWGQMQEKMAEQQYIPFMGRGGGQDWRGGRGGRGGARGGYTPGVGRGNDPNAANMPQRTPPPNYICFRCGEKGHFINNCPTNGDKEFDKHPRIKRTTGIPRSFLKVIEQPKTAVQSGTGGVMVTPGGDLVVAEADSVSWQQYQAKSAALGNNLNAELGDLIDTIPVPDDLQCPICMGIFKEAVITQCCGSSYCDECIRTYMLENDLKCQDCHEPVPGGTDGLIQNVDVRQRVISYVREFARNQLAHAGQKRELEEVDIQETTQEKNGNEAKIPKTE